MRLEVEKLSFAYGKHEVLHEISFQAEGGELVAVLGPNGAGKSTLFRCILGLLRGAGSVRFDGQPVAGLGRRQFSRLAAYIPQTVQTTFNYTVLDTVLMGTTGSLGVLQGPGTEQTEQARRALKQLGIESLAGRGVRDLSGGERQLVMIARALVQRAQLLLVDEPTASLDYGNRQRVLERIRALTREGYTVLMSTHEPEQAFRFAKRVLALRDGRVLAQGPVESVLDEALIRELYHIDVTVTQLATPGGMRRVCVPNDGKELQ